MNINKDKLKEYATTTLAWLFIAGAIIVILWGYGVFDSSSSSSLRRYYSEEELNSLDDPMQNIDL